MGVDLRRLGPEDLVRGPFNAHLSLVLNYY